MAGEVYPAYRGRRASREILCPPGFYFVAPDTRYRRRASISAALLLVLAEITVSRMFTRIPSLIARLRAPPAPA
jgi:hypothetical protein